MKSAKMPTAMPRDTKLPERLRLSTSVILLDNSVTHQAFGCLYRVKRYGGNPVAYVPRSVAIASGVQKLFSAVFIFLFGLAVRNMLKVK
jgi:hypothetical protein